MKIYLFILFISKFILILSILINFLIKNLNLEVNKKILINMESLITQYEGSFEKSERDLNQYQAFTLANGL